MLAASGENLMLPASAVAEAVFLAPAWIVCVPPVVVIACAVEASLGEMYACVVATRTTTARAADLFWLPSAVVDLPSPLPPAASVCFWFTPESVPFCVGLLADVSVPSDLSPFGLAMPVVGAELSVSADRVRLAALIGVAALLSMNASESVTNTATAMPAPSPAAEASAVELTFVVTLDVIATGPLVAIELVPESWVLPIASTNVAATDAF